MAIFFKWGGPDLGGSVNMSKGRAGEKGGQEPHETQQGEMQSAATPCHDRGLGTACLGGEQVSHKTTTSPSSKGGQQHPWIYEQEYGQGR